MVASMNSMQPASHHSFSFFFDDFLHDGLCRKGRTANSLHRHLLYHHHHYHGHHHHRHHFPSLLPNMSYKTEHVHELYIVTFETKASCSFPSH